MKFPSCLCGLFKKEFFYCGNSGDFCFKGAVGSSLISCVATITFASWCFFSNLNIGWFLYYLPNEYELSFVSLSPYLRVFCILHHEILLTVFSSSATVSDLCLNPVVFIIMQPLVVISLIFIEHILYHSALIFYETDLILIPSYKLEFVHIIFGRVPQILNCLKLVWLLKYLLLHCVMKISKIRTCMEFKKNYFFVTC